MMNTLFLKNYPRMHDRIRRFLPFVLLIGSVGSVAVAPEKYVQAVELVWGIFAILIIAWAYYWSRRAANIVDGKMVDFVFAPTPLGSLGNSLAKQGIDFDQIDTITVMSSNLAETKGYLKTPMNGDEPFLNILDKFKDMHMVYYGFSNDPNIKSDHPRVAFVPIKEKITEHKNLITTKNGPNYMWYEPCHDIVNGDDYFGGGAYLIELTEKGRKQAEEVFKHLPQLESKSDSQINYAMA